MKIAILVGDGMSDYPIEELGKKASAEIFSSFDAEKAADVMEELEPETQVQILESLSIIDTQF